MTLFERARGKSRKERLSSSDLSCIYVPLGWVYFLRLEVVPVTVSCLCAFNIKTAWMWQRWCVLFYRSLFLQYLISYYFLWPVIRITGDTESTKNCSSSWGWLQKLVNPYKMSIFTEMKLVFYNLSVDIFSLQNNIRGLISKQILFIRLDIAL